MAMIRCSECRKDMSDTAAACPHCGAPIAVAVQVKQSTSTVRVLKWVGGFFLVLLAVHWCNALRDPAPSNPSVATTGAVTASAAKTALKSAPPPERVKQWVTGMQNEHLPAVRREEFAQTIIRKIPKSPEGALAREALPELKALVAEERTYGPWKYASDEDAMTGKRVSFATVRSENTISLDFPYRGAQHGSLQIRKHPKWGNDVIVFIERGQIKCSTIQCPVSVRFDDDPPVVYEGNEPADNSTETVFLPYAMAKRIKSAKRVRIQLTLFQNGAPVLEFNVKGFDPDRLKN